MEAKELQATLERDGANLKSLELKIPVMALKTGMEIRVKHMRERVFTAADGKLPDIVFKAKESTCQAPKDGVSACEVKGSLSIRGVEKPYVCAVNLKNGNQVEGHVSLDVTDFGVTPAQLAYEAIKVNPKVVLDFSVKMM